MFAVQIIIGIMLLVLLSYQVGESERYSEYKWGDECVWVRVWKGGMWVCVPYVRGVIRIKSAGQKNFYMLYAKEDP